MACTVYYRIRLLLALLPLPLTHLLLMIFASHAVSCEALSAGNFHTDLKKRKREKKKKKKKQKKQGKVNCCCEQGKKFGYNLFVFSFLRGWECITDWWWSIDARRSNKKSKCHTKTNTLALGPSFTCLLLRVQLARGRESGETGAFDVLLVQRGSCVWICHWISEWSSDLAPNKLYALECTRDG